MAYNKAPTKEKLRTWGRLCRKGDKIKDYFIVVLHSINVIFDSLIDIHNY